MRFLSLALRHYRAINAAQIWAVFAFIALTVACGSPPSMEDIGGNWIRLNGTPSANNPFIEIGCVVTEIERPTLTFTAGNDMPINQFYWRVNIGEWGNESAWEHLPSLLLDRHTGMPPRPTDFEIFRQMVNTNADSMTITMGETYTFPLTNEIKAELRTRYPENCYTEPIANTPTPAPTSTPVPETLEERYRLEGEALHQERAGMNLRWRDGSHWEDGVSHELPNLPLEPKARISDNMTCIQAEALEAATFPYNMTKRDGWHLQSNAAQIASEWERRHADVVWGRDDPRRITWIREEEFKDWCGSRMQEAK